VRARTLAEQDEAMSYTGDVMVGGPADVHELTDLIVTKVAVGPYDNNAYLLRCRGTGVQVLVDAAAEPDRLLELIGADGLAAVVTTHRHGDHWQALADVVAATGARTYASGEDAPEIPVTTDEYLFDGDSLDVGDVSLSIIALRGHTPGSIALLYDDPVGAPHLFTGDSLFPGGPGNTEGDAARFDSLMTDLETRVFDRLPDETWVYPGHGKDTTLGAERASLPEWRVRGW
jgi:glyoxylase-like metal-dependent hydrolase (beta-lactamase superfamily II)